MGKVIVTYHAKEQFNRLSTEEQAELKRLLAEPDELARTKQVGKSERFVSRFGQNKRAYWTRSDDGTIVVLSVVHDALAA